MTDTRQDLVNALSAAITESEYCSATVMETGNWTAARAATDAEEAAEKALNDYDAAYPAELAALQVKRDELAARRWDRRDI